MIPVMQTKFGKDGNCLDACLASMLEIPLEQVTYFKGEDTWYLDLQKFLEPKGLAYVEVDRSLSNPFYRFPLPLLVIAGGDSIRGVEGGHAVIMEAHGWDLKLVHDPHPDGTGLLNVKSLGLIVINKGYQNKSKRPCAMGLTQEEREFLYSELESMYQKTKDELERLGYGQISVHLVANKRRRIIKEILDKIGE